MGHLLVNRHQTLPCTPLTFMPATKTLDYPTFNPGGISQTPKVKIELLLARRAEIHSFSSFTSSHAR